MDASPAWVDDVIVIFPQDGNPVSWRLKHGDDEVSYFVDCWNLLSREAAGRCQWPAARCIQFCWQGLEWRQAAKWGSEHVENRMCLMSGSVRWECSLHDSQPRGHLRGLVVGPCLSWRLRRAVERASPTSRNEKKNWFVRCFKSFSGEERKCDANELMDGRRIPRPRSWPRQRKWSSSSILTLMNINNIQIWCLSWHLLCVKSAF